MIRKISLDASNLLIDGKYTSGDILLVVCDATLNNLTIQLPDASAIKDVLLCVKKNDVSANTVTVITYAGQTINLETSQTITQEGDNMILASDGENYHIL